MKVSLNWLKDYVDIKLPVTELARKLTMAGSEVTEIVVMGESWEHVMVGEVTAVNPHPNADRLRLVTVNLGENETTVVCGAPNVAVGIKIAFAQAGAQLFDAHRGEMAVLKPAKIRGVESCGMVCSELELGLTENHEGILVLPEAAPVGMPLADYLGDTILDIDLTPNRPDCLSVLGIAHEVAALTDTSVREPAADYPESGAEIGGRVTVEIADPDLCPRYAASLIEDVTIGESPDWLKQRLISGGMRPINNVVDVTNYVMLEYGQPLHAFDYKLVRGGKIIVHRAREGECLATLDGTDRELTPEMLVIADEAGAVAVAGVMGGANSEVSENTAQVLLEAANFNPASIHHTGGVLKLSSEARTRFERGIRPELAVIALRRATRLIAELGGGRVARGIIDCYPGRLAPSPIKLSVSYLNRLLGSDISREQAVSTLESLGFDCQCAGDDKIRAVPPYWRSDINLEVDLVEEVARIIGYDEIPTTLLRESLTGEMPDGMFRLKRNLRNSLIGFGFAETVSYSLVSAEMMLKLRPNLYPLSPRTVNPDTGLSNYDDLLRAEYTDPIPIRLANPMSAEHEYLRPNLWGSLLTTLAANRKHEDGGIRLFELGRVYRDGGREDLPEEPEIVAGVMSGLRQEKTWHGEVGSFDFYDVKGLVEALMQQLGVTAEYRVGQDPTLRPERQFDIIISGCVVGMLGELHPRVGEAFEIPDTVCLFMIDLDAVLPHTGGRASFQPMSRFPAVARDVALVVDAEVTHDAIYRIIVKTPLVTRVTLFDVYSGKQVPPGKKSLAYRILFQSPDHTLTDKEVDRMQRKLLGRLSHEFGATLRA